MLPLGNMLIISNRHGFWAPSNNFVELQAFCCWVFFVSCVYGRARTDTGFWCFCCHRSGLQTLIVVLTPLTWPGASSEHETSALRAPRAAPSGTGSILQAENFKKAALEQEPAPIGANCTKASSSSGTDKQPRSFPRHVISP